MLMWGMITNNANVCHLVGFTFISLRFIRVAFFNERKAKHDVRREKQTKKTCIRYMLALCAAKTFL